MHLPGCSAAARVVLAAVAASPLLASGPLVCASSSVSTAELDAARLSLRREVEIQGVRDRRVLEAIGRVPRHEFVSPGQWREAYDNRPLPIGEGQTISQPYVVAAMTEALELDGSERVLEVGTGSGYQAAILGELAAEVYSLEILPALAERAASVLARLGYANVHVRHGDGYAGWPEHAPFDAIVVTAAPDHVPEPLVEQLALGGRMVVPVGPQGAQELVLLTKDPQGVHRSRFMDVRFVPMTGEAELH